MEEQEAYTGIMGDAFLKMAQRFPKSRFKGYGFLEEDIQYDEKVRTK